MELPPLATTSPGQSLVDAIYVTLRDAIIRGELPAGLRLREVHLSEHFDVSTTPVRSALQRLDFEGLIEINPRRGAVVTSLSEPKLVELYELRDLLECHALGNADLPPSPQQVSEIEQTLAAGEEAADRGDIGRFNQLDVEFHAVLTRLAGNIELARIAELTHRRIQAERIRYAVELPEQPQRSHEEHLAIAQAVTSSHNEHAVTLLREHITSVRDVVLPLTRESEGV